MGWTTFNKPKHISPSDYFRDAFKHEPNHELLDIAIVKRMTAYMAVRLKDTGEVIALVYMLTYSRTWDNFGYKDMSEFAGPVQSECPKRILELLTPLPDNDDSSTTWAKNWRERCWAKINNRTSKPKVKEGDVIKVSEPLEFRSGISYDTFQKTSRTNVWKPVFEISGEFREIGNLVKFQANKFKYEVLSSKK
jgi:hypothetical protein